VDINNVFAVVVNDGTGGVMQCLKCFFNPKQFLCPKNFANISTPLIHNPKFSRNFDLFPEKFTKISNRPHTVTLLTVTAAGFVPKSLHNPPPKPPKDLPLDRALYCYAMFYYVKRVLCVHIMRSNTV
jgi:hypothetical protein